MRLAWIVGGQHKVRFKLDKDRFPDFQLERDGQRCLSELVKGLFKELESRNRDLS
ncbi:MAG TPA: hypothetical protein VFB89_15870 [Gemmatimonadales bacterium]|nr:hypothetical protein [Gemmatimonadales bacterium]